MPLIQLENAVVEIPIFNAKTRSLKNAILSTATGGRIGHDRHGKVAIRALEGITLRFNPVSGLR